MLEEGEVCPECGANWETDGEFNLYNCKTCQLKDADLRA